MVHVSLGTVPLYLGMAHVNSGTVNVCLGRIDGTELKAFIVIVTKNIQQWPMGENSF